MPKINILNIQTGDAQSILIDKINYNFDQILTAGGGPQGSTGKIGSTGPIGPQGQQGPPGPMGGQGSKWYVQATQPGASGPIGITPWGIPSQGDYWLSDASDPTNPYGIYVYEEVNGSFQWQFSNVQFSISSEFSHINTLNAGQGLTTGILRNDADTEKYGLILSDYKITGTDQYSYGSPSTSNGNFMINGENAKLKIATLNNTSLGASERLISFGIANLDKASDLSEELRTYSKTNNPYIGWTNRDSGSTSNPYSLDFKNPGDNINIEAVGNTLSLKGTNVNIEATNPNITGKTVTITRTGDNNTYNSIGNGTYDVSGSYIRFSPSYTNGNFIVGDAIPSSGTSGSKGVVISSLSNNGNYLVFKTAAANSGDIYGGIAIESSIGNSQLGEIVFTKVTGGAGNKIDVNVGLNGGLTIDQYGNTQLRYGTQTGSNRDTTLSLEDEAVNATGANFTIKSSGSNSGNYQGGNLYLKGGAGGGASGNSGNVIINPGDVPETINARFGSVYLQANYAPKTYSTGGPTGVAIGLPETTAIDSSLVVADTNPGLTTGNILKLIKGQVGNAGTSGTSFFGFNKGGYLTNGLPYDPSLGTHYDLSNDAHNLDYYEEGTWTGSLTVSPINPTNLSGWTGSVNVDTTKANYTRVGNIVTVDFSVVIEPFTTPVTLAGTSGISDSHLYITGFPYEPDFTSLNSTSTYPYTDHTKPIMPVVSIKATGLLSPIKDTGSTPIGTIQIWPGDTAPTGWFICNGSYKNIADYPLLAAVLGTSTNNTTQKMYGTLELAGYPDKFALPDMRGYFVRGFNPDNPNDRDYGRPGGLGSTQQDSIQNIVGGFGADDQMRNYTAGPFFSDPVKHGTANTTSQGRDNVHLEIGFDASRVVRTSDETRPINIAMNYIIYAGIASGITTAPTEITGAFVKTDVITNFYLYDESGNLSAINIPSAGNKYINGTFSYYTNSAIPYSSTPRATISAGSIMSATSGTAGTSGTGNITLTYQLGTVSSGGAPYVPVANNNVFIQHSTDGSTWSSISIGGSDPNIAYSTVSVNPAINTATYTGTFLPNMYFRVLEIYNGSYVPGTSYLDNPIVNNIIYINIQSDENNSDQGHYNLYAYATSLYPVLTDVSVTFNSNYSGSNYTTVIPSGSTTSSIYNIQDYISAGGNLDTSGGIVSITPTSFGNQLFFN